MDWKQIEIPQNQLEFMTKRELKDSIDSLSNIADDPTQAVSLRREARDVLDVLKKEYTHRVSGLYSKRKVIPSPMG
jgi:hypothetical protein